MSPPPSSSPPADGVLKSLGHLVRKSEDGAAGAPVFRITSAVLDRHNDRVMPGALKTDAYNANPVLLWNHEHGVPAIGTARVFQEGNEWLMEPTFDGIGELSEEVGAKVKAGTLRTCSIFFKYGRYELNAEGGHDYFEAQLLEISITNIPANPEASRVKANTQPKSNDTPTPPAEAPPKTGEPQDVGALLAEQLKPLLEALNNIQAALGAGKDASEEPDEPPEEEGEAAKGDEEEPAPPPPAEDNTEAKSLQRPRFRSPFVCG